MIELSIIITSVQKYLKYFKFGSFENLFFRIYLHAREGNAST